MPSSGKREGAGRKFGSVDRKWRHTLAFYRERYAVMPLDHLLGVLNATKGVSNARRDFAAKAAAPYLHPRLATTEISGEDEYPEHYSMDLTKLTDEELIAFERMLIKAHRPVLSPPIDLDVEVKSATA